MASAQEREGGGRERPEGPLPACRGGLRGSLGRASAPRGGTAHEESHEPDGRDEGNQHEDERPREGHTRHVLTRWAPAASCLSHLL
eukprot:5234913-Pyramimonas_sp.AAC.1